MKVILTGILTAAFRGAMILGNRLRRSPQMLKKERELPDSGLCRAEIIQHGAQRHAVRKVEVRGDLEQRPEHKAAVFHIVVRNGQHMAMKQPYLSVCGKETEPCTESWNICGSLCSMNDIIAKQISLPDIEIGDIICFENTGAYCMTEGISLFLSRDIPSVYIKKEDGTYLCVRDSFEKLKLNQTYIINKDFIRKKDVYNQSPIKLIVPSSIEDTLSASLRFKVHISKQGKIDITARKGRKFIGEVESNKFPAILSTPYGIFSFDSTCFFKSGKKLTQTPIMPAYSFLPPNVPSTKQSGHSTYGPE